MEELQLKYIEIIFDKQMPQCVGTEINILTKIDRQVGNLEYKFIVGKGGIWNTIQEFSEKNECMWKPKREGDYMVMVQGREKDGRKPLDYLAKEDYSIVRGEATNIMHEEVSIEKVVNEGEVKIDFKDIVDGEVENLLAIKKEDFVKNNIEFKEAIDNTEDNVVFLEVKELSKQEEATLIDEDDVRKEVALCEDVKSDNKKIDIAEVKDEEMNPKNSATETLNEVILEKVEDNIERELSIINEIIIDKEEIVVGEKCSIEVETVDENRYLYRFYIKKYQDWDIVRDYDTSNILKYTATEAGKKEFLIQCKRMESTESFEDYRIVKVNVKNISKIEITNFKCLSTLVLGDKLEFIVETNVESEYSKVEAQSSKKDKIILLYKFYKIYKDGKSVCLQDYSTKNHVSYKELEDGSYRILCLVKSILSNKEYDDRAILVYTVKPYKDIKINNFVADLNSPQTTETDIKFTSEVQGGENILYKYKVKGPIAEDTGFINRDEFTWKPMESGEYEIILYVKDVSYKEEYEATKKIAFTIEKKGKKPVKILDVVVDKEKKIITGEPVNIMINAEGGTKLQYAFTIRKDNRRLECVEYSKANWINFIPKQVGEYEIEIMIKDKYSNKPYDAHTIIYLKAMEYLPGEIDYIILPYKETHLIGEAIEFECIIQNTQNVVVKYETKINGNSIEQTGFSKNKKLRFVPKIPGKYTIEVYAKNLKCKGEYDSKKQVSLYVSEAPPVIETKIITNKVEGNINEELTFEAISRGGKDVCYEFYLMENNEWKKVQAYSKKHYYSFIPFIPGKYKILALAKSYYKKVNYEDYDQLVFYVKGLKK